MPRRSTRFSLPRVRKSGGRRKSSWRSKKPARRARSARKWTAHWSKCRSTPRLSGYSSQSGVADGGGEEQDTKNHLAHREHLGCPAFAPGASSAFGEVGEDQHARPLVGVSLAPQNAGQRQREG